jgi:hypothetical protein
MFAFQALRSMIRLLACSLLVACLLPALPLPDLIHVAHLLRASEDGFPVFHPARRDFLLGDTPLAADILDYNLDGAPDMAVLLMAQQGEVRLLEGGPGGFFHPVWSAACGTSPKDIGVMNVNGDNLADLVVATGGEGLLLTFLGDPAGYFTTGGAYPAGTDPSLIEISNLTGDASQELLLVSGLELFVYSGNTEEAGLVQIAQVSLPGVARSIRAGDFDADGFTDVIATYADQGITLHSGNGNGELAPGIAIDEEGAASLATADFDLDGDEDILRVNTSGEAFAFLLGEGGGMFRSIQRRYDGFLARSAHAGPPGLFGLLDVVSVSEESGGILVHGARIAGIAEAAGGGGSTDARVLDLSIPRRAFSFAPKGEEYRCGEATFQAISADADGDAIADLLALNRDSWSLSLFYGMGDGYYHSAPHFPAAKGDPGAKSVAVFDANEDGHQDLAVTFMWNDSVSVLLGDGTGNLTRHRLFPVGDEGVHTLAIGDLNEDAHDDIVVRSAGSGSVSVLLGNGMADFTLAGVYPTGARTHYVSIVDLDLDGHRDVVAPNSADGTLSVLMGDGTGSLVHADLITVGQGPHACVPLDFQGDGYPDLAVVNTGEDSVALLENRTGSLVLTSKVGVGVGPLSICTGDFNEDTIADLATANFEGKSVSVITGVGGGAFAHSFTRFSGKGPHFIIAEDFDLDGHTDLASPITGQDAVLLLRGAGDGSFPESEYYGVHDNPHSVAACDMNEDGLPDLVAANVQSHDVTMLIHASAPAPLITK